MNQPISVYYISFLCDDAHKFRGGRAFVQKKKRHFFSLMYVSNSAVSSPYYIREQQQQQQRDGKLSLSLSLSFRAFAFVSLSLSFSARAVAFLVVVGERETTRGSDSD
jgi:hypothetical protein